MAADSSMPLRAESDPDAAQSTPIRRARPRCPADLARARRAGNCTPSCDSPRSKPRPPDEQVSELTTNRLSIYLRCLDSSMPPAWRQSRRGRWPSSSTSTRRRSGRTSRTSASSACAASAMTSRISAAPAADPRARPHASVWPFMGAGNLGLALADYPGFRQEGFEIVALFDNMREKVGQPRAPGVPIHRHPSAAAHRAAASGSSIGVIAVPAPSAQAVVDLVVAAGIKAILNFSPGTFRTPAGREAEERRPDGLAGEPLVLSRAR